MQSQFPHRLRRSLLLSLALATLAPAAALAAGGTLTVNGARFDRQITLAGAPLQLNGAGVRYKFVVKVYAAGLYLKAPAATPEAAFSQSGPKRMQLIFLRAIGGDQFGRLFTTSMEKNVTRDEFVRAIPGTLKIADMFAEKKSMVAGDVLWIDDIPGQGTVMSINSKPIGEPITEPGFFNILTKIWLGPDPADERLKKILLGQSVEEAGSSAPQ